MKKISSLLFLLLLMLASFTTDVEYQRGDVNQDGQVTIGDVTCLIDYLLNGTWEDESLPATDEYQRGDVNHDGQVTIGDVTCLIDYLLNGTWEDEPVTPPEEHEWVDLGLQSGTLWATCNVGADSPEDYGDLFAWGETAPKDDVYYWTTYKWCDGTWNSISKYCTNSYYGTVDNKTELDPEDDAAYVNWGPSWRMPTMAQQEELFYDCDWTWTSLNGVNGYLVTGPNGNTIFLPAAGEHMNESIINVASNGFYWSRTLESDNSDWAYYLGFTKWNVNARNSSNRIYGLSVRPVSASQN